MASVNNLDHGWSDRNTGPTAQPEPEPCRAAEAQRLERKQLEQQLQQCAAQLAKARADLDRQVLAACARERQRIGQELHDGLGQQLTGIAFLAQVLEARLAGRAPGEAAEMAELRRRALEAVGLNRRLVRGLLPLSLEAGGLGAALAELASDVTKLFDVSCVFQAEGPVENLGPAPTIHLHRIAQEAVGNAIKHGQARHVVIRCAATPEKVALTVSDDGIGFDASKAKGDRLGLRIMRHRARSIGASLQISRGAQGGTVVSCALSKGRWPPG
jgi:signal transduction histidine kinase